MIRLILGNIGSGKTARIVKEIVTEKHHRVIFTNIKIKKCKHVIPITRDMIIKTEVDEKGKETLSLNVDYWKEAVQKYDGITVIIDEAHTILNPRKSMSKINTIVTDWIALLRRVIGEDSKGLGELILITQLSRRIDVIVRDMAHAIQYHKCHYKKTCDECGLTYNETNQTPEKIHACSCGCAVLHKHSHSIEVWHFSGVEKYESWQLYGLKSYHRHYFITDIEDFFPYYNTLQWDNLLSNY